MKRMWCRIVGHELIPVRREGTAPRPGGMLPMLDGYATFVSDEDGEFRACVRCRRVLDAEASA